MMSLHAFHAALSFFIVKLLRKANQTKQNWMFSSQCCFIVQKTNSLSKFSICIYLVFAIYMWQLKARISFREIINITWTIKGYVVLFKAITINAVNGGVPRIFEKEEPRSVFREIPKWRGKTKVLISCFWKMSCWLVLHFPCLSKV